MATRQTTTDLQPHKADHDEIAPDVSVVAVFVSQISAFWARARVMEFRALQMWSEAQTWAPPTSQEEDARLVETVRHVKAFGREFDQAWAIKSAVHRLRMALTERHKVGAEAIERAAERGEALHAQWVETEARRVREETERRRHAAEAQAAAERARELELLETAALDAEAASLELSPRERVYVRTVVEGRPEIYAASYAGYKDPEKAVVRLRQSAKVQAAIGAARDAAAWQAEAAALKAQPLVVTHAVVASQAATGGVTTWSAEVVDAEAFLRAYRDPQSRQAHGIPDDAVTVNQTALNRAARDLHELINGWPGVRAKKTPRIR